MTRSQALRAMERQLTEAGIENASFDAAQLCCHVLGTSRAALLADGGEELSASEEKALFSLAARRKSGFPLQYLLGEWEFYGRPFSVGEGVLIPRQDTEVLCEQVISFVGNRQAVVLDLCSGSGCIAVTVAAECPNAEVYAVEKSEKAFPYLLQNIRRNDVCVSAVLADALGPEMTERFPDCDVIVSNPPYLTKEDMAALQKEVSYEPSLALYGGEDGLFFYRELTSLWKTKLKPSGRIFYEIGAGQERAVGDIFQKNGLHQICEARDLCGIIRVVSGSV